MWYIILIFALLFMTTLWATTYLKSTAYDGHIFITHQGEKVIFSLELGLDPDLLETHKSARFNIVHLEDTSAAPN